MTSPGTGIYIRADRRPAWRRRHRGTASASTVAPSASAAASTKLGTGLLNLAAASTYTGPTVVSNGTLRLAAGSQTLSPASALLAGGTLDL